jgi:superfamily II DNA or RNA helicase
MDGETPKDERRRIIRAFARREILILCNVEICTTGFDLASASGMDVTVEGIIDLRPTKSLALQLQKWGRGLRKKDYPAIILDHVNNSFKPDGTPNHGLPDDEREWSLADEKRSKRDKVEKADGLAICPKCFCHHAPKPVCPNCGHTYEVKGRVIEQVEGELLEVDKAALRKVRRVEEGACETLEDFIALGKARGYQSGWAYRRFALRKKRNKSS